MESILEIKIFSSSFDIYYVPNISDVLGKEENLWRQVKIGLEKVRYDKVREWKKK